MFPLKLIGIAMALGAAGGVWASGAIKEKLGGGSLKKVKKGQTEVIYLDPEVDTEKGVRIVAHKKVKPEVKPEE